MTDIENEICYNCGKANREHSIQSLYMCLSRFSNMIRTFDRAWNYSVLQCTRREMEDTQNVIIHPEFLKP